MNKETQSTSSIILWIVGILIVIWLIRDNSQSKYNLDEYNRTVDNRFVPSDACLECIQKYMDNKRAYEMEMEQEQAAEDEVNNDPRY